MRTREHFLTVAVILCLFAGLFLWLTPSHPPAQKLTHRATPTFSPSIVPSPGVSLPASGTPSTGGEGLGIEVDWKSGTYSLSSGAPAQQERSLKKTGPSSYTLQFSR